MTTVTPHNQANTAVPRVLLGVCGGVAAYKAALLARLLTGAGYQVQVVMTEAATQFIGEHTFQALTGRPVRRSLWDPAAEAAMGHIELARWADLIVIAPTTANTLARLRLGMGDDLLSTLCLASQAPLVVAPAMNQAMWQHPATQDNMAMLRSRGVHILGPANGDQACGDVGPGRMLEPQAIADFVVDFVAKGLPQPQASETLTDLAAGPMADQPLAHRRIVITAGPTVEDIDPVRFIANRSSGRMGYALATAARDCGAQVVLISGPTQLSAAPGVTVVAVRSALEMAQAVEQQMADCDIFIAAAAVADYRVADAAPQKLKKQYAEDGRAQTLQLTLTPNPDILATVAARPDRPFCVGFAAETEDLRDNARRKRQRKGVDLIAANWVSDGRGFDARENALLVVGDDFEQQLPQTDKQTLAQQFMALIGQHFRHWRTHRSDGA